MELVGVKFGENGEFILSNVSKLNPSNFYIYDLDFSKAKRIEFQRVYLEDLKFPNVRWGNINTNRISPEFYRNSPAEARDIYRQLKLALDKQENYIDARGFYALELQAHGRELERELRITGWWGVSLFVIFYIAILGALLGALSVLIVYLTPISVVPLFLIFFIALIFRDRKPIRSIIDWVGAANTLMVYYIYGITADFGLSWFRPLVWLVATVSTYIWLTSNRQAIKGWVKGIPAALASNLQKIYHNLNEFAKTFFSFLPNVSDKQDMSFINLLFLVFISYLVYQTIIALRRRVRR
ncbi:MAG: hypothetical protein GXO39_06590 [Thermotogae bacterium]|nr:hypothetical protein [Thermotogota bacterium]